MTPDAFVHEVIEAYSRAHFPVRRHPKLLRGESRSVASETEDLLAFYLASSILSIDPIFINQPVTIQAQPRFKPDLAICRGSQICALLDVKMDLGYKRDSFDSTLRQADDRIVQLRGQVCGFWARIAGRRERIEYRVSQHAKYLYVVVSDLNVSPGRFDEFVSCASSLCNTSLHVLTRDFHPNDEGAKTGIIICYDAFERAWRMRYIARSPKL